MFVLNAKHFQDEAAAFEFVDAEKARLWAQDGGA